MAFSAKSKARNLSALVIIAMLFSFATASPAAAMYASAGLMTGGNHGQGAVQCPRGRLVVNVTQRILNDLAFSSSWNDLSGHTFAIQKYTRHIQAWKVGQGVYCAEVSLIGSFVTVAGGSPGGTDPSIAAGIKGELLGRYVSTLSGLTPIPHPAWKPRGYVGTVDNACDPLTFDCPGYVNWVEIYFNVANPDTYGYTTHDFRYQTRRHGTFIQHLDTFEGDITDGAGHDDKAGPALNAGPIVLPVTGDIKVRP